MKFDLSVLYVLRRAQTDMKGLAPISSRITVNGNRSELSTGRKAIQRNGIINYSVQLAAQKKLEPLALLTLQQ
jgi:hypothetical protein